METRFKLLHCHYLLCLQQPSYRVIWSLSHPFLLELFHYINTTHWWSCWENSHIPGECSNHRIIVTLALIQWVFNYSYKVKSFHLKKTRGTQVRLPYNYCSKEHSPGTWDFPIKHWAVGVAGKRNSIVSSSILRMVLQIPGNRVWGICVSVCVCFWNEALQHFQIISFNPKTFENMHHIWQITVATLKPHF